MVAAPLEELITDAVLYRLDTPELAAALAGRAADDVQAAAVSETLAADREQLDELAQLYAARQIKAREWMTARNPIEDRIAEGERRLARLTRTDALAGWVGQGKDLRTKWEALNLTRQAAIVAAVLDHAVIAPAPDRRRIFDPTRVQPMWRL